MNWSLKSWSSPQGPEVIPKWGNRGTGGTEGRPAGHGVSWEQPVIWTVLEEGYQPHSKRRVPGTLLLSEGFSSSPGLLSVSWGSGKRGAAALPEGAQETSPPCPLVVEVPGLWAARNTKRGWSPAPGEAGQVGPLLQGWV